MNLIDSLLLRTAQFSPFDYVEDEKLKVDDMSYLPLAYACAKGDLAKVKELVENGADIHENEDYAFRAACINNQLEVAKYLLGKGSDIHSLCDEPIIMASYHGRLEMVQFLANNGADIYACNNRALCFAVENKHTEVAKFLRSFGRNANNEPKEDLLDLVNRLVEKKNRK